jgi:hypothetical protein
MQKNINKYVCTSISLSDEEKDTFTSINISENTDIIQAMYEGLEEEPMLQSKRDKKIYSMQIKMKRDVESYYRQIQEKCKECNVSFSNLYKKYYLKHFNKESL